jgi:hypothetical protein
MLTNVNFQETLHFYPHFTDEEPGIFPRTGDPAQAYPNPCAL